MLAPDWLRENAALWWWLGAASLAMFVVGVLLVPLLAVRMPEDYFLRDGPPPASWRGRHPFLHLAARAGKNLLGALLVVAGVVMLALPGQGVLTILLGVSLLEFPGKRRLERRIASRPAVLGAINWTRAKLGKAPLRLPA
ncbi:MAG: hypothetical protein HY812_07165 [Planctomycetes bacterium]|nr:hypothetical protein [Planctomycetota bacterium]